MAGFTGDSLAFGSTNDFRTLASIPLPGDCLASKGIRDDFRMLPRKRSELKAAFVKVFVDEARDLVIGVLPDHLLAAPLSRLNLPAQKSITVTKRLPAKAYVNEPIAFELETEAEDVTFEVGDGRDATGQVKSKIVLGADGFEENLPRIAKRIADLDAVDRPSWLPNDSPANEAGCVDA